MRARRLAWFLAIAAAAALPACGGGDDGVDNSPDSAVKVIGPEGGELQSLDGNLRKFDEQAARMVTYFNDVSQSMEQRQDELSEQLKVDIAARLDTVQTLVEENDANIRRFQAEVGQTTSQKINDAEDRFNNRLLAAESRMKEDAGQKIAEIDAHVGRVSAGLDETMLVLNDRIAGQDARFVEADRRMDAIEESIQGVDAKSIDELKEKMSTAVGEAMLAIVLADQYLRHRGQVGGNSPRE